jgi:hypothetical protein
MVDNAIFALSLNSVSSVHFLLFLYTDPGSGALLWQLLLASFIGVAFYARVLIRQVKTRLAGFKRSGAVYQEALIDPRSPQTLK